MTQKFYEFESGKLHGRYTGATAGKAFRAMLLSGGHKLSDCSDLVRFRELMPRKNGRYEVLSPWFYQQPSSLRKQP